MLINCLQPSPREFKPRQTRLLMGFVEFLNEISRTCRREFKRGFLRGFKRGQILERVFCEYFGPVVERRTWWFGDRPELSERMMD